MVEKRSADEIIESIAHVTRHADRDLLEASLASTLYTLLDVTRVVLYRVFYEYNKPQCYPVIEVKDNKINIQQADQIPPKMEIDAAEGLEACLKSKRTDIRQTSEGNCLYLYPVVNHLGDVASIFALHGREMQCQDNENFIAGYFQIYRNYLRLLDESEHDTLTGLLNRRTFEQNLAKILAEWHKEQDQEGEGSKELPHRRQGESEKCNWLAVIDIDFFKRINDKFGHLYGDEVLVLLANIMRESFRGYDKLFRFGGEEFVAILRTTNQAGAIHALERFRQAVAAYAFPQIGQVTVSIGFVEIAYQAIPTEVLGHADDALYYAKEHGRNRLCQYEQLVETGEIKPAPFAGGEDAELF
ncbi:GGDEF domain-containing protein [Pseudomonadota bacterium]